MLLLLAALVLTPQGTDTSIAVRGTTRLELSSADGSITVDTWNQNTVRVRTDDDDARIDVDQSGRTMSLRARARYGPSEVNWRLTVPAEMALDLSSQSGDVRVSGARGEVSVSSVEGAVSVQGGASFVSLSSVNGDIELTGASGRIQISAVDGKITLRGIKGDVKATAVDGDILLDGVESSAVDASTVDGAIEFTGPIRAGGRYGLSSHDGNVTVVSQAINAEVTVSTFSGDFKSDYPVTLRETHGRGRMDFTLGSGGARLDLASFDGTVSIRKTAPPRKP